jgi:hypothetical protein
VNFNKEFIFSDSLRQHYGKHYGQHFVRSTSAHTIGKTTNTCYKLWYLPMARSVHRCTPGQHFVRPTGEHTQFENCKHLLQTLVLTDGPRSVRPQVHTQKLGPPFRAATELSQNTSVQFGLSKKTDTPRTVEPAHQLTFACALRDARVVKLAQINDL